MIAYDSLDNRDVILNLCDIFSYFFYFFREFLEILEPLTDDAVLRTDLLEDNLASVSGRVIWHEFSIAPRLGALAVPAKPGDWYLASVGGQLQLQ